MRWFHEVAVAAGILLPRQEQYMYIPYVSWSARRTSEGNPSVMRRGARHVNVVVRVLLLAQPCHIFPLLCAHTSYGSTVLSTSWGSVVTSRLTNDRLVYVSCRVPTAVVALMCIRTFCTFLSFFMACCSSCRHN